MRDRRALMVLLRLPHVLPDENSHGSFAQWSKQYALQQRNESPVVENGPPLVKQPPPAWSLQRPCPYSLWLLLVRTEHKPRRNHAQCDADEVKPRVRVIAQPGKNSANRLIRRQGLGPLNVHQLKRRHAAAARIVRQLQNARPLRNDFHLP